MPAKSKTTLIIPAAVAVVLLACAGVLSWRRGLSDGRLLEAGRMGVIATLRTRGVDWVDAADIPKPEARRRVGDEIELDYHVTFPRARAGSEKSAGADKLGFVPTGDATVDLTIRVGQGLTTMNPPGLNRPIWVYRSGEIRNNEAAFEKLWDDLRTGRNLNNLLMEVELHHSEPISLAEAAVTAGGLSRMGNVDGIAGMLLGAKGKLTPPAAWTGAWRERMEDVLGVLEIEILQGRVKDQALLKRAIREYREELARPKTGTVTKERR